MFVGIHNLLYVYNRDYNKMKILHHCAKYKPHVLHDSERIDNDCRCRKQLGKGKNLTNSIF